MSSSSPQRSLTPWVLWIVGSAALAVGLTCWRFASGTLSDKSEMDVTVDDLVQIDDFEQSLTTMFLALGKPLAPEDEDPVLALIAEFEEGLPRFADRPQHTDAFVIIEHALVTLVATQEHRDAQDYDARVQEAGGVLWNGVQSFATVTRREARDIANRLSKRWGQVMTILLTISGAALISIAFAWRFLGSRAQLEVAEKDLANVQDRLSLLINNTPIVLWAIDRKGTVDALRGCVLGAPRRQTRPARGRLRLRPLRRAPGHPRPPPPRPRRGSDPLLD